MLLYYQDCCFTLEVGGALALVLQIAAAQQIPPPKTIAQRLKQNTTKFV